MRSGLSVRWLVALVSFVLFAAPLSAQLEPPSTGGLTAFAQGLRMLGHDRRVLMIGAHPDDEDTELLTVLVRGMGAEAAYLSLNRGEGGQNLIGPELGPALGLLRTEELLAARRLDGARQFFSRVYDFGYSKTLDDTWAHWPRDSVLKDVVRVIRQFRPQIVVSVFSGTPRDGHGQHQAAGWAAHEAFRIAGDSTRFPELAREERLAPWTPRKLYRSTRFDTAATTLTLAGGVLDPATGRSYHQIAMASRSLHRSQDMGQLQKPGPSTVRLALVESRVPAAPRDRLFAGIDTTLAPELGQARWRRYRALIDSVYASGLRPPSAELAELLARARRIVGTGTASTEARATAPAIADQLRHLDRLVAAARGLVVDAIADDDRIVPGQIVRLTLSAWNAGMEPVAVGIGLDVPPGWASTFEASAPPTLAAGVLGTAHARATAPARGEAEPGAAPRLTATFALPDGTRLAREVTFRRLDQAVGEVRRPLVVAPRIDVKLDPPTELWSTTAPRPHRFTVTLTHGARDSTRGTVRLVVPPGWSAPPARPFTLTAEDEREVMAFVVAPPSDLAPGEFRVRAVATDERGTDYATGVFTVDYPHIRPRSYAAPAEALVRAAPLALPPLEAVGYVRGAADRVPEALRAVGVPIELLDAADLERADLGRLDAIVIGPRAYETEPALAANHSRLMSYVRNGGLLIVQYQQYGFFSGGYAPYPLAVASRRPGSVPSTATAHSDSADSARARTGVALLGGHDRVTDESAPVTVVDDGHPALRRPNEISERDWEGWVQERGLYFARSWDPAYQPILETHDPGEPPLRGGLLVAEAGKGTYVYTGLSFFRQLPAGVPGAFRLFANLLGLR